MILYPGLGLILLAGLLYLAGCIDPFTPDIGETGDIMVINGRITDQEGFHYVEVSRTSPLYKDRGYNPVSLCTVLAEDDNGKIYEYSETENEGIYYCWIDQADLNPGKSFKLTVITPDDRTYISDFEQMLPCPPIEDIPWEYKETETSNPLLSYTGVQFYISTNAGGNYAENYLWELEETWEYHTAQWIRDIYDSIIYDTIIIIADSINNYFDTIYLEDVPDDTVGIIWGSYMFPNDSLSTCYRTQSIPQVYSYSAKNISGNFIRRIPINYVSDQSSRLSRRYSLLARQYSLTDRAYEFWKTLDGQSKQSGELYGTQPVMIRGNIQSADDPEETVLGLFFTTAITEKRIFIRPQLRTKEMNCDPVGFEHDELLEFLSLIEPEKYPIYLYRVSEEVVDYADQRCFDCRKSGGSLDPPDFWED